MCERCQYDEIAHCFDATAAGAKRMAEYMRLCGTTMEQATKNFQNAGFGRRTPTTKRRDYVPHYDRGGLDRARARGTD